MKNIKAILLSMMLLFLFGCSTINYAPLPDENAMFTEKGQLSIQGSANIRFYQGQVAYSPIKGLGLTYGYSGVWKNSGSGYSHGLSAQHYGSFKPQGNLHYSIGLSYALGTLDYTSIQKGRGEFYYGTNRQRYISKYGAHALAMGLYWKMRNDNLQVGFHLDIRSARYTNLHFTRTELDNHPRGYDRDLSNKGEVIAQTITSLCFTIKATSENGLFYMKESFGFRANNAYLSLYDLNPNAYYPKDRARFRIPYVILNIHLGMNIDGLYRRKK